MHTDHLGTPRKVTDDAGKVAWQWAYSAFGDNKPTGPLKSSSKVVAGQTINMLKATQPTVMLNLRFPGQYFDSESNLSYNYFRSYWPAQGRYDQPDPIGLAGGWNRTGYVGGNPFGLIDPMGLTRQDVMNGLDLMRRAYPDLRFPSEIGFDKLVRVPLIAPNPRAHTSKFTRQITMDDQFLKCLSHGDAQGMLITLLHEILHYNQSALDIWTTGPDHSRFDDEALWRLMNHPTILKEFEKKREECTCRR